jgi:uncharacterized membrane protein
MVLMALDHTRDFFAAGGFNPRDVAEPALFLTRWMTHFCAPVFILLAGISAFLYGARQPSKAELSRFLLTRGLWLVAIEFTVVRLGWTFSPGVDYFITQVIFAIGASMIALAGLVHAPRWMIASVSVAMIGGHNLLDEVKADQFGAAAPLWNLLHEPALLQFTQGVRLFAVYPLIPWVGVMAAGYALGPLFARDRSFRVPRLVALGTLVTGGFIVLRASNIYGDPATWATHDDLLATILSFVNCEKYPPSLLYLAMTIGPALLMLAALEQARGTLAGLLSIFGRVPFFYYIAHIFLIHALAVAFAWATSFETGWLFGPFPADKPDGYGLGLAGVYAVWIGVVVALYPLCRWFAALKHRRREWWWSYL